MDELTLIERLIKTVELQTTTMADMQENDKMLYERILQLEKKLENLTANN